MSLTEEIKNSTVLPENNAERSVRSCCCFELMKKLIYFITFSRQIPPLVPVTYDARQVWESVCKIK